MLHQTPSGKPGNENREHKGPSQSFLKPMENTSVDLDRKSNILKHLGLSF